MTTLLPRKKGQGRKVEQFTLNATQAGDMEVFLADTPKVPSATVLDLPNGTVQSFGLDFDVNTNKVFWNGFSLETVLAEGDKIIITYT